MPAVKKELLGRKDLALALATFHPTLTSLPLPPLPAYLAPLPAAAALPSAASLPASASSYETLLAPSLCPPRAYLNLHEAAPHLYLPGDPLAFQCFSATASAAPDFQPLIDNGEPCIEVECGANRALLYVRKLCQGSKGPSIRHRGEWLTPNEFQFVSGRETAKDWKRSIRHKGKSLKTLMSKGILQVHPPICDCPGCRISSPVNRGRLADKRTVTLPPTHALKKERTSSFSASDGDSDGIGPACEQQPVLKQEDDPHVQIMKKRVHTHWDVNISFRETSCSVHRRSRHHVMPEHPSHCDFQRGNLEIGLGPGGDLLGKRLGCSSYITNNCSSEKKARSKSPQETLLLPELESTMAPEDHYHRLMSALCEAGPFEETQRLYHLGIPSHDMLRVRQEVATATLRNPNSLEVHLPSSTAGHRRKQGLVQHREGTVPAATPSFSERELSQPPPLLSPQNAPHIALGAHLRPPFLGVPTALCQTPGYSFLAPAQAEMLARQQELLRKQNLARLEMSELLRQKELGSAHRPQLLAPEVALHIPESPDELQRRGSMLVLKHSSAPLLALPSKGPPSPGPPTPSKESARSRSQKGSLGAASAQSNEPNETGLWAQDVSEEPSKDSDGDDPEIAAARVGASTPSQVPSGGNRAEGKGLLSGSTLTSPLPLGFPCGAASPYFHTGTMGGLFTDEGTIAPDDVNKWTVDDVCNFVGGLSGCGEYARVFREQGIDGETLPLLTEEHLLNTMGLKLGPALKIRAQVAKRLGRVFYMASFPVALPLQPPSLQAPELSPGQQPLSPATTTSPYEGAHLSTGRASPKQENGSGTIALLPGAPDTSQLL
ncbi:sterile alpha motif domain-containing protein 11 isoform X2 [Meriones unguiculatus]|uniref:sterile alpha motif domain-containing protein 11 isoform X2 n=1 Tax=Meriones unguiculatus TaxID=10047 RepID=UPI000B4F3C7C|nr:sterile alpha motif domain-containing protein 11 isoform X2 [Meriones unguiculatus]